MAILKITATVTDGSNQFEEEVMIDLDKLRTTPNPRQCVVSTFLDITRKAVAEYDPSINI